MLLEGVDEGAVMKDQEVYCNWSPFTKKANGEKNNPHPGISGGGGVHDISLKR